MRTTANFAPDSTIASLLLSGLNRQIEHQLFPRICHVHYPAIAPILRKTAAEFNLPYIESPSFWAVVKSHHRILKKFGKEAYQAQSGLTPAPN